ncbi:MAG: hypothetical protein P8R54_25540 [Myxococcota bacterium]|nr:hypothetical protein [Myxococcota bacterium]
MRGKIVPVILTGLLIGCTISRAKYPEQLAASECDLYESCDLLEAFGGSYEQCEEIVEIVEIARVSAEACDYSGADAQRCIEAMSEASCDDLRDDALEEESPCEMVCG